MPPACGGRVCSMYDSVLISSEYDMHTPAPAVVGARAALLAATVLAAALPAHAGNQTWTGNGPRAKSVYAIARDPLNASRMWAATFGAGVYRSLDGGATWSGSR